MEDSYTDFAVIEFALFVAHNEGCDYQQYVCAGQGAVTHQDFIECERRRQAGV